MDCLEELGINTVSSGACVGGMPWETPVNASTLTSINPANEKAIARVCCADAKTYDHLVQASQEAFCSWRQIPAPKRGDLVRLVGEALRQKKDALGTLISLEMGKIKQEGDGEVQEMIDMADFAVGQSRMLYGATMPSERPQHRMFEQWHPLGPVGVITAFNFPVAVWAWNAFLAAIAGNTVLWKPSPKTPLCAIAVQNICNQVQRDAGLTGIFNLFINDDNRLTLNMVDDRRLPLISFTGSCSVGAQVGERVAARMGKSLLELGGNNAVIVDETADLKLAVPAIVFGAVGTAGQRCTSTRRLIVHESIVDDLVKRLVSAYGQVTIGDPLAKETLMGPLIDQGAIEQYKQQLQRLQQEGADILCGATVLDQPGFYVTPTLIRAENHWVSVQEETFAPILYVLTYQSLAEAIEIQNAVPQGLSSAIFTTQIQRAEHYLSSVGSDCGIANVNIGTSGAEIGGAFGGEKATGGGREAGSDAWKAYMRRQTNTINWSDELPLAQGIKFVL